MRQTVPFLRLLRQATPQRRRLLLEALFTLTLTRPALRRAAFQTLAARFRQPVAGPEVFGLDRERLCGDARWAIRKACRVLPGKTVCFPRAIAAQTLLRRRGVGTELYYGAAILPEQGLKTHVWLQDGDRSIVGCRAAAQYRVLACYSSRRDKGFDHVGRHHPDENPADLGRRAGL